MSLRRSSDAPCERVVGVESVNGPDDLIRPEWAPFRLLDGVKETELFAASEALQSDLLATRRGVLRRELVHVEGDRWGDIVYWQDEAAARQAMESAASSPVCFRYFKLMADADHQEPGEGVQLLAVRRTYPEE